MPASPSPILEIEQKFRVESHAEIVDRLLELKAVKRDHRVEHDTYFAHPVRCFAETDEAFRIRSVNESHVVTYKGPRSGGLVKTRREIEFPVGDHDTPRKTIIELLESLGFATVADVCKNRTTYELIRSAENRVAITLDEIVGLPPHIEIEVVSSDKERAETIVRQTAADLRLCDGQLELKSYLELCLKLAGKF